MLAAALSRVPRPDSRSCRRGVLRSPAGRQSSRTELPAHLRRHRSSGCHCPLSYWWKPSVSGLSAASIVRIWASHVTMIRRNATPRHRGSGATPISWGTPLRDTIRTFAGGAGRRKTCHTSPRQAASFPSTSRRRSGSSVVGICGPGPVRSSGRRQAHRPPARLSALARRVPEAVGPSRCWHCGTASGCRRLDSSPPVRRVLRLAPSVRRTTPLVAPASRAAITAASFWASIEIGRSPWRSAWCGPTVRRRPLAHSADHERLFRPIMITDPVIMNTRSPGLSEPSEHRDVVASRCH
jgi:hypothetical protein